ncbi:MAG: sulfite exporter TauE/SafE family protein [Bacteroidales bacterium]|nr:sulfite exporter TauE/SafE family protein [Bacteroidales bacterium]
MDYLSALLLGLSSGIACISICLPGMVPILLGQSSSVAQSAKFVTIFLSGRWLAYLLAAVLSSILSAAVYGIVSDRKVMIITQLILGVIMLLFALGKLSSRCINPLKHKALRQFAKRHQYLLPLIMGFVTSVALCPPFVSMVVQTAGEQSFWRTVALFSMFFVGTLPYFLPVPLVGLSRKNVAFKHIGRYAAIIMCILYFYNAIKLLIS